MHCSQVGPQGAVVPLMQDKQAVTIVALTQRLAAVLERLLESSNSLQQLASTRRAPRVVVAPHLGSIE